LDRDFEFEASKVGTKASVDADPKCHMPVLFTVDLKLVSVLEGGRVMIGSGESHKGLFPRPHWAARHLGVSYHFAAHRDR
jgi:hypothetical protein